MPDNLLESLDVFYGELTPARATIYARLEGLEKNAGLSLQGTVRGPIRLSSWGGEHILATSYRLRYLGSEPSFLAEAIIPDPCYWSPNLDQSDVSNYYDTRIYEVEVELCREGRAIERTSRKIALRPLGIKGRYFSYAGKSWILRGVDENTSEFSVQVTRELPSKLSPVEALGNRFHVFDMGANDASHRLSICKKLASSPDYCAVLFPADQHDIVASVRYHCPNLLIGRWVRQGSELPNMANSDFLIANVFDPQEFARWGAELPFPMVAVRALWVKPGNSKGMNAAHSDVIREIDQLQRDLAPYGQFAGYIV